VPAAENPAEHLAAQVTATAKAQADFSHQRALGKPLLREGVDGALSEIGMDAGCPNRTSTSPAHLAFNKVSSKTM
jgi:hypothetical protein